MNLNIKQLQFNQHIFLSQNIIGDAKILISIKFESRKKSTTLEKKSPDIKRPT